MEANSENRCPHYQLFAHPLNIDSASYFLTVRRCLLSERLIGLLAPAPDGDLLTQKLIVRIHGGMEVAVVGPDLDPVTQTSCTVGRCEERCTPAYSDQLAHFNVIDPHLEQVTCDSEEEGEAEMGACPEQISAP